MSEKTVHRTKQEMVPLRHISDLQEGDIVRGRNSGYGYVVMEVGRDHAIAVRTVHISNPGEWPVLRWATPPDGAQA